MRYKEVEAKYAADEIGWQSFRDLVESLKPYKWMMVSSYDDYFVKEDNFIRYRYTDERGELTIKKKTVDKNNNERIEVNLTTQGANLDAVSEFCGLLGYSYNFGIFKTCQIAWVDKAVLVYYIVYDKQMKECRRFIEIEADEHKEWESEAAAWEEVVKFEKLLEPLGITAKNRMKKSLYELFKK